MILGEDTDATAMPTRRGPCLERTPLEVPSVLVKHHSMRSPGCRHTQADQQCGVVVFLRRPRGLIGLVSHVDRPPGRVEKRGHSSNADGEELVDRRADAVVGRAHGLGARDAGEEVCATRVGA